MTRVVMVLVGLLGVADQGMGDEPKPHEQSPHERMISGEDKKQVEAWAKEIASLEAEGKRSDAAEVAEKLLSLRKRVQGVNHWQVKDAERVAADLQRELTPEMWKELVEARGLNGEFKKLYAQGNYREAEVVLGRILAIRRRVLGNDHPHTGGTLSNLAAVYHSQGKYAEAESLCKNALRIQREAVGENHPSTARSLNNLASLYHSQGKYAEAEPLCQAALRIYRETVGVNHPATATSMNNLAASYYSQGKYSRTESLYEDALRISRKVLGNNHKDTARSLNNLALLYESQGRYTESESLVKEALRIHRGTLGNDHPNTATSLNNLAALYHIQGNFAEAEPLLKEALRIHRKAFGENHPDTATSLNYLARLEYSRGKYAEAEPLYEDSLRIRRRVFGNNHEDTATGLSNLASLYQSQGKYAEAEPLYTDALRITRRIFGDTHPKTASTLNNLATLHQLRGNNAEAENLYKEAYRIYDEAFGENHPGTATSLDHLAVLYKSLGRYAEAEPLYQDALRIRRKMLGNDHSDTATSLNNLAVFYKSLSRYAEAEPLYQDALRIKRDVFGNRHPDTAMSLNNLAWCKWGQGKRSEAIQVLRESVRVHEATRYYSAATGFSRSIASADTFSPRAGLAVALAQTGDLVEAFRHADAAAARGLLDDLESHQPAVLERQLALSHALESLNQRLLPLIGQKELSIDEQQLREKLLEQRENLSVELAALEVGSSTRQLLALTDIQQQLPENAALICWVEELDEQLCCVLRRKGRPQWVKLPGAGQDGEWIDRDQKRVFEAFLALQGPDQADAALSAAWAQRIKPLLPHLKGATRLIVVPTGEMAALPVEALTQHYEVIYTPSPSAFARSAIAHRGLAVERVLVVADPVYRRSTEALPLAPPHGLLVNAVLPKGLASKIGLHAGDVLLEYADKKLTKLADFDDATEGDRVVVKLWREGKELSGRIPPGKLGVVLDERPVAVALKAWRESDPIQIAMNRGDTWAQLPGTRLEARMLQEMVPSAKLLLGSEASQQSLMEMAQSGELKKYRILHFATHGQAVPELPRRSALILAQNTLPTNEEQQQRVLEGKRPIEGRLDVDAILEDWELDADLVVLSACQTGLGKQTSGAGMLGFTQALLQKGARSVVLSRWKVDDAATALLMHRFYHNLLKENMGRAAALREAKTWLRTLTRDQALTLLADLSDGVPRGERGQVMKALRITEDAPTKVGDDSEKPFEHPYYWAAFILVGDPD